MHASGVGYFRGIYKLIQAVERQMVDSLVGSLVFVLRYMRDFFQEGPAMRVLVSDFH